MSIAACAYLPTYLSAYHNAIITKRRQKYMLPLKS